MAVDLVGALLGWLTAGAASGAVRGSARLLLGDAQQRALQAVVASAVGEIIAQAGLEPSRREHLTAVLHEGAGDGAGIGVLRVTTEEDLRGAFAEWTSALDRPELDGHRYLSEFGLRAERLADDLANAVLWGIRADARRGGPLGALAQWLWREHTSRQLDRIEQAVGTLRRFDSTRERFRGALPGQVEHFLGRTAELATLQARAAVHDPAGVVVAVHAVTGMAGVGKTALVVRAARMLADRYPDGEFFVDLHGYTAGVEPVTAEQALAELLDQAGLHPDQLPAGLAARQAAWRRLLVERQALVVLDNARDSAQVRTLLPMAPGCLVLITSRSRLPALTEAVPLPLDVLALPDAAAVFVAVAGADRCPELAAVDRVVLAAGRLPLAVRLAAGRLRVDPTLTVRSLATELHDVRRRLQELSPEYAGVRAAFSTSVSSLNAAQLRAFRYVGIYPGPTLIPSTFAALADVSTGGARSLLSELADQNLVIPASSGDGESPRFELHDLVRDYARELAEVDLDPCERAAALDRLGDTYRELANSDEWRRLAAERENVVSFGQAHSGETVAAVCLTAAGRLHLLGHNVHARSLYHSAHRLYALFGDQRGQANTLDGLGEVARMADDYTAAAGHYQAAYDIYTAIGDRQGQANSRTGLGDVAWMADDYTAAGGHFQAAYDIFIAIGDQRGQANILDGLGNVARMTDNYTAAAGNYRAAYVLYTAMDDRRGKANTLDGLGRVALDSGDYPAAGGYFRAAYDIYATIGDRLGQANTYYGLGEVAWMVNDYTAAGMHFRVAYEVYTAIRDRLGQANAQAGLGRVTLDTGDHAAATAHFRAAYDIYTAISYREGQAMRIDLGRLEQLAERYRTKITPPVRETSWHTS